MPRGGSHGFTLLELLIAFAITAVALSAFFGGVLTGLGSTDLAARQGRALAIARSRLAAMDPANAVTPGTFEGDEPGHYHWTLTVVPRAAAPPGGVDTARPLILYDIQVRVRFPGGLGGDRAVALATRRIGSGPP
jgi:general secretion pathway protein I